MKFPSLNTPLRIGITVGAIAAGIVVLSLTMVLPSLNGIRMLASSIEIEHARIEPLLARGAHYHETVQQVEAIKKDLPVIRSLLLNTNEEITLFAKLKEISGTFQLTETIRVGEALPSGALTELPIDIELHGTYPHVLQYIHYLESAPVLIPIKRIEMRAAQGNSNASFIATLSAVVYSKNQ